MCARREPPVSVVVVNWNRASDLQRCVESVLEHTTHSRLEVIVVDNGSTDGSAALVRTRWPAVKVIENSRNLGAAAARNQGMAAAQGELIALLDCDTYVIDNVIGRTAQELADRSDVGMIGCELRFPGGRRQHSAHRAMSIRLSLFQNLWLYRLLPKKRRAEVLLGGYWEEDRDVEADWLVGAFIVVRRTLFLEYGGFDPRLFPEDSEWGIRLTRAGQKILYAPRLGFAYHTGSASNPSMHEQQLRRYHRAGLEAYRTLNGPTLAVFYRWAQLLGAAVRCGAYRIAMTARPSDYFASQMRYNESLVEIYLRPHKNPR